MGCRARALRRRTWVVLGAADRGDVPAPLRRSGFGQLAGGDVRRALLRHPVHVRGRCRTPALASAPATRVISRNRRGRLRRVMETAKRAAVATLVVGGIVALALAMWELRLLVALLFLAFIFAAAMRPTVDRLAERGIPRGAGIGLHYLVFVGLVAAFLWAVVPRAIDQVNEAVGDLPQTRSDLGEE